MNSYEQCVAELKRHGLGPRARSTVRRAVGVRSVGTGGSHFAKSFPAPSASRGGFDALLDDLGAMLDARDTAAMAARARGDTAAGNEFRKALGDLDRVYLATAVKPIIVRADALVKRPNHGRTIAKAFAALDRNDLTQPQRIRLTQVLAELNSRAFAKSESPVVARIDEVTDQLNAALAAGHAKGAEPLINEALKLIASGNLTPADHARLSLLLGENRTRLKETTDAPQDR
jgi:hypothetical protein